jgi:hypothetical protein
MRKILLPFLAASAATLWAEKPAFDAQTGVVSDYYYRGLRFEEASLQSSLTGTYGPFSAGVWNNTGLSDSYRDEQFIEFDTFANYDFAIAEGQTLGVGATWYYIPTAEDLPTRLRELATEGLSLRQAFQRLFSTYRSYTEFNVAYRVRWEGVSVVPKFYYQPARDLWTAEVRSRYESNWFGPKWPLVFTAAIGWTEVGEPIKDLEDARLPVGVLPFGNDIELSGGFYEVGVRTPIGLGGTWVLTPSIGYASGFDTTLEDKTNRREIDLGAGSPGQVVYGLSLAVSF